MDSCKDADYKSVSWTERDWGGMINAYSRFPFGEVNVIGALENEKKVYDVEDIQKLLGIGRSKAYAYLDEVYEKQEPFRVIKIGKLFRVPRQSFDNWLDGIS
ncbi:MAG: helix-turn-helix domain-containing protein [Lachnospiraceae bacterium]|nr:helix-turn-helix domain-containing protein [Lachnospiraceae bacterium]